MANNIETLFPNSRTETTKKGKKNIPWFIQLLFSAYQKTDFIWEW